MFCKECCHSTFGETCVTCGKDQNGVQVRCHIDEIKTLAHTNCIPRSELPGLPSLMMGGFTGEAMASTREGRSFVLDDDFPIIEVPTHEMAEFLAALLNTCYPAPTATENGAGK